MAQAWPAWSTVNERGLAVYVQPSATHLLDLSHYKNPDDLLMAGTPAALDELVGQVYGALSTQRPPIQYVSEFPNQLADVQVIRSAETILQNSRRGTCLDLALLFAGLCLGLRLSPVLLVLRGALGAHALVAVSRVRVRDPQHPSGLHGFNRGLSTNVAPLSDPEAFLVVECSGVASTKSVAAVPELQGRDVRGQLPFQAAITAGTAQLQLTGREVHFALDLAALLDQYHIQPLSPESEEETVSSAARRLRQGTVDERLAAARLLGDVGTHNACQALRQAARREQDPEVRYWVLIALSSYGVSELEAVLGDPVRRSALDTVALEHARQLGR